MSCGEDGDCGSILRVSMYSTNCRSRARPVEKAGGDGSARKLLDRLPEGQVQHGHSAILAPDGVAIAQAGAAPEILMAEIDLDEVGRGLATMDVDGVQARHDVFELSVDRRVRTGIVEKAA